MGIVSSTLATGAIRVVWVCQMFLDPKYSCIESEKKEEKTTDSKEARPQHSIAQKAADKTQQTTESRVTVTPEPASVVVVAKSNASPATSVSGVNRLPENNNSLHQENRNRRARQLRFRTRPSSFGAALIVRGKSKSSLVVTSSSPLRRQNVRVWKVSSSSGCSSDSGSNSEPDSETELRVSENVSNEEGGTKLGMSAEEEAAFRLTVGRGHFTRSKKDRFLNQMRLEKRLNDLNNECFNALAGRGLQQHHHHRLPLQRRHSGDLHRIM